MQVSILHVKCLSPSQCMHPLYKVRLLRERSSLVQRSSSDFDRARLSSQLLALSVVLRNSQLPAE